LRDAAEHADETEECYETVVSRLAEQGLLSRIAARYDSIDDAEGHSFGQDVTDDLVHVKALFAAQLPNIAVHCVYRVENAGLAKMYRAVRHAMSSGSEAEERILWHGTSVASVRNIVQGGFNRAYCGRHGTKLGQGTYFSSAAAYSAKFCDKQPGNCRAMLLAKVFVGSWTKGKPGLVEPPYRDTRRLARYDSVVDDVEVPGIFCVFRDFQAVPLYLVEFAGR
jgi:poly [ADP-ribose] polymerase 10/14/15